MDIDACNLGSGAGRQHAHHVEHFGESLGDGGHWFPGGIIMYRLVAGSGRAVDAVEMIHAVLKKKGEPSGSWYREGALPFLGAVYLWQMTGDEKLKEWCSAYVERMSERLGEDGRFSSKFWLAYSVPALLAWHTATEDERAVELMRRLIRSAEGRRTAGSEEEKFFATSRDCLHATIPAAVLGEKEAAAVAASMSFSDSSSRTNSLKSVEDVSQETFKDSRVYRGTHDAMYMGACLEIIEAGEDATVEFKAGGE